MLLYMKMLFL